MAYRILVSAPVPFWVYLGWNWVGLGGDLGLKGWGLGLDNNDDYDQGDPEEDRGKHA